ncbi:hypothetical protein HK102_002948, partial [Quaeritorhiza haematococci]
PSAMNIEFAQTDQGDTIVSNPGSPVLTNKLVQQASSPPHTSPEEEPESPHMASTNIVNGTDLGTTEHGESLGDIVSPTPSTSTMQEQGTEAGPTGSAGSALLDGALKQLLGTKEFEKLVYGAMVGMKNSGDAMKALTALLGVQPNKTVESTSSVTSDSKRRGSDASIRSYSSVETASQVQTPSVLRAKSTEELDGEQPATRMKAPSLNYSLGLISPEASNPSSPARRGVPQTTVKPGVNGDGQKHMRPSNVHPFSAPSGPPSVLAFTSPLNNFIMATPVVPHLNITSPKGTQSVAVGVAASSSLKASKSSPDIPAVLAQQSNSSIASSANTSFAGNSLQLGNLIVQEFKKEYFETKRELASYEARFAASDAVCERLSKQVQQLEEFLKLKKAELAETEKERQGVRAISAWLTNHLDVLGEEILCVEAEVFDLKYRSSPVAGSATASITPSSSSFPRSASSPIPIAIKTESKENGDQKQQTHPPPPQPTRPGTQTEAELRAILLKQLAAKNQRKRTQTAMESSDEERSVGQQDEKDNGPVGTTVSSADHISETLSLPTPSLSPSMMNERAYKRCRTDPLWEKSVKTEDEAMEASSNGSAEGGDEPFCALEDDHFCFSTT